MPLFFSGTYNIFETSLSGFNQEEVDDGYEAGIDDCKNDILDHKLG